MNRIELVIRYLILLSLFGYRSVAGYIAFYVEQNTIANGKRLTLIYFSYKALLGNSRPGISL